jgi:tetratricopeptide (TPR) repeat protein
MSFAGDLSTFDLFDLLAWVHGRRRSGTLVLTRLSTRKRLAFRDGALQRSSSNDPRETVGQALVRERLITEEALFTALLKQETDRRRLGEILIGDGLLTESQLIKTLATSAEAQIQDLCLWPDGHFAFDDAEILPETAADLHIDLRPVLEEGRYRRERWQKLCQRFPSGEMTFKGLGDPAQVTNPARRQVLTLAAAGKTLSAISLEARRPLYDTALLLAGLCDEGVLVVESVEPEAAETDPVGMIKVLLESAEARHREGRYDAALEAYERVLALDGVNQEAKKGLLAVTQTRRKAKAVRGIPLDKVPVLKLGAVQLAQKEFDPQEGFVLSRVNGQWDIQSILKLCPLPEEDALLIFKRLHERKVIDLR